MRFSIDESTFFLERAMGLQLDDEAVRRLNQRTEGWIAGSQMAALAIQQRGGTHDTEQLAELIDDFGGQHRYVIDFLAAEVLRHQPEDVHAFLRDTAVLDRLCAPLYDRLTGCNDGEAMLAPGPRQHVLAAPGPPAPLVSLPSTLR